MDYPSHETMHQGLNQKRYSGQEGTVLIVSMLILMVMAVVGVTAMQTNLLEEKMAGNYRDVNLAFQAAEAALRDAEDEIEADSRVRGLINFDTSCTNGLCNATGGLTEVWSNTGTKDNGVSIVTYAPIISLDLVVCQPQYWIEGFRRRPPGSASWKTYYRITAESCGRSADTHVLLQTVYATD